MRSRHLPWWCWCCWNLRHSRGRCCPPRGAAPNHRERKPSLRPANAGGPIRHAARRQMNNPQMNELDHELGAVSATCRHATYGDCRDPCEILWVSYEDLSYAPLGTSCSSVQTHEQPEATRQKADDEVAERVDERDLSSPLLGEADGLP